MSTKSTAIEVIRLMGEHHLSLCFAESCTAGGVPKIVTSVPGASEIFLGGITAYRDDALAKACGLTPWRLAELGSVSQVVTDHLARAALDQFGADICVATTGYLGPFEDDSPDHREGFVVVLDSDGVLLREKLLFEGRREANRQAMLTVAFDLVLRCVVRKIEREAKRRGHEIQ